MTDPWLAWIDVERLPNVDGPRLPLLVELRDP
jgi:hypothetical protein